MIFAEPPPSQGDLRFRLFGFPVRIHPWFWIVALLLGAGIGRNDDVPPAHVLSWIVAMLISILIHELGHAFLQRRYGGRPRIVLHGMGGLAICGDCDRSTRSQILISLAGPAAGFAFAAVLLLGVSLFGHQLRCVLAGRMFGPPVPDVSRLDGMVVLGVTFLWDAFQSPQVNRLLKDFLWINILWAVVNLLPIYPLDGGHVSRELFLLRQPRQGMILSLRLSVAAAAAMAIVGLFVWKSFFTAILFGYLGYSSYKTLEAYRSSRW